MLHRAPCLALLAAAGLLAPAGCGGGETTSVLPPPPIAFADFHARYQQAACAAAVACGAMPDAATCLRDGTAASATLLDHDLDQLAADVAAGKVSYDQNAAGACVAAVGRLGGCDGKPPPDTSPCATIFHGLVPAGGACFADRECAGDSGCQLPAQMKPCGAGKCAPRPARAAVGAGCANVACVVGAYCAIGKFVCKADVALGESCADTGSECAPGSGCTGDPGSPPVCALPPGPGKACNPNDPLVTCTAQNEYCDPQARTCAARVAVGAPCSPLMGNPSCVRDAYCDGLCKKLPDLGEPCDPSGGCTGDVCGSGCLGSLACDAKRKTCALAPAPPVCAW